MAIAAARWVPLDKVGLNQPIDEASTTQHHRIGETVRCRDTLSGYGEGLFIYMKGVASLAVADFVHYEGNGTTIRSVAGLTGPMAIAMAAPTATQFGWFQIEGRGIGNALTGFADDADVYLTATPGSVDDAPVVGDNVHGCKGDSAIDTGQALFTLDHPHSEAVDAT